MPEDPYLYPGSGVLRNRRGCRVESDLEQFEAAATARRRIELDRVGVPDRQGLDLLKGIHRYLFQDVFDWAGEIRTVSISKASFNDIDPLTALAARRTLGASTGHDPRTGIHTFTPPDRIEAEAAKFFTGLSARDNLRQLDRASFVAGIAEGFHALNAIHPFREGNGRVQQLFWTWLGRDAGHPFDFAGITRERMIQTSIDAAQGDLGGFRRVFDELLDPVRKQSLTAATEALRRSLDISRRYIATTTPGETYRGVFAGTGNDGRDFLLGQQDGRIMIGRVAELPDRGKGITAGQSLSFIAAAATEPEHTPLQDRVSRFRAARAAQTGPGAAPSADVEQGPLPPQPNRSNDPTP